MQVIDGALNFERTGTDLYGSLWLYTSPYKALEIFGQLVEEIKFDKIFSGQKYLHKKLDYV